MRELGIQAWHAIAAGVLMALLTLMMFTGLGARRGTWLHRVRISMWMLVMALGGAAGCGEGREKDEDTWTCVECYYAPDDEWPDQPDAVDPDVNLDVDEVTDISGEQVEEPDATDATHEDIEEED